MLKKFVKASVFSSLKSFDLYDQLNCKFNDKITYIKMVRQIEL